MTLSSTLSSGLLKTYNDADCHITERLFKWLIVLTVKKLFLIYG